MNLTPSFNIAVRSDSARVACYAGRQQGRHALVGIDTDLGGGSCYRLHDDQCPELFKLTCGRELIFAGL